MRPIKRDDIAGERAVQLAELAYMRASRDEQSQELVDDLRELICLARGWEFEP